MTNLHPTLAAVTDRIRQRSALARSAYLARMEQARVRGPLRGGLGCTNLAHGYAGMPANDKLVLRALRAPNVAIVSAYNDMLSAHQPYERFPAIIKRAAREAGGTAQFAGGVPAMCDGVTQGEPGMELSLFSRDVIALATAVALSHNMFDAVLCLGICDKIVPGLLIGALQFSHLPTIFVPGGPMPSGLSNDEKARVRQRYTKGEVSREVLLEAEEHSYHSPGTCTFYGTANSNQMLMEVMGLHLPSAAFVNPDTPLRDALTAAAAQRAVKIGAEGAEYTPIGRVVDERAIANAIVGLLATGGSTNHTIHLVAIARAAGITIDWNDFEALSDVVPLLVRVYPNGKADVNQFQAAGGMAFVIRELLGAGLLHGDVTTVAGEGGLARYTQAPALDGERLVWRDGPAQSGDASILLPAAAPFSADGGLKLLAGNLGRAVIKTSAVKPEHRLVEAPAIVFDSQEDVIAAFDRGELDRDFVAVVRWQGPRANGMPELHKLTPLLSVLQDQGRHVALVTDGRMSGASGKVPAAIHVTPECLGGGPLARVRTGDVIRLDAEHGALEARVDADDWRARRIEVPALEDRHHGLGRELFAGFRAHALGAEQGAVTFYATEPHGGAAGGLQAPVHDHFAFAAERSPA
jgi:phosphogluconate dehydratase